MGNQLETKEVAGERVFGALDTAKAWQETFNRITALANSTTEVGNAEYLARRERGKLLHVAKLGWHVWDGQRWLPAERGEVERAAKCVAKKLRDDYRQSANEASQAPANADEARKLADRIGKWAFQSESAKVQRATIELARSEPPLASHVDDMDQRPMLLNTTTGTLDLETFELREHDPYDRLTKVTGAGYVPGARSEAWESWLAEFVPSSDVRGFLARAFGAALVGRHSEFLLFLHGDGANGKSTLLHALEHALGDYATQAMSDMLVRGKGTGSGGSARNDSALANLRGARLVITSEIEQGQKMAEVLVKQLTGESTLKAKMMRMDPFEFENVGTLVLAANHKPEITGVDYAIWRRIKLVPFDVTVPEERKDEGFKYRLAEENADAILAWAVEGLREFQRRGLDAPPEVDEATANFRLEQDTFHAWVEDTLELDEDAFTATVELEDSYRAYTNKRGRQVMDEKAWRGRLRSELKLGEPKQKKIAGSPRRGYIGVRIVAGAYAGAEF